MQITLYSKRLLIIFISIFMGCNSNSDQYNEILSKSLIVLPKAKGLKKKELDGTIQYFYNVQEKYPASKPIGLIETQLNSMGWSQLKYDELNFSAPTSLVTGWSKTKDQKIGAGDEVHIWYCTWKNANGDYLKYQFQYFSPEDHITEQDSLLVGAILVPAKIANRILDEVKSVTEKNK